MKMFPKTQDHAIDRLLRTQGGSSGDKPSQACRTFDPDLANAYVERSLMANETARYEQHLAVCSSCRKAIIVLTRMAAADLETAQPGKAAAVAQIPGESRLKRLLGALTVPQWAMAATAVIALALAVPLILSHRSTSAIPNDQVAGGAPAVTSPTAPGQPAPVIAAQAPASGETTANSAPAATLREPNPPSPTPAPATEKTVAAADTKKETSAAAAAAAVGAGATAAPGVANKPDESKPVADNTIAERSDQPQPTPPATQPAGEAPLPKIDPSKAKQLPSDKDTAQATTIKPGQTDGEERSKTTTAVQSEAIAPPPVRGPRDEDRRGNRNRVAAGGASAFRDAAEAAPAPRGEPRKVANHVFFLRGDVWTDKDYNPHKEMSVVTLVRDSNTFNEVVAKDEKLKRLLTSFNASEQFLVVYKGVAYKIRPQNSSQ